MEKRTYYQYKEVNDIKRMMDVGKVMSGLQVKDANNMCAVYGQNRNQAICI